MSNAGLLEVTPVHRNAKLPKLNLAQRQIPIRVRLDEGLRHDLDAVHQLRVPASKGAVPLDTVADIRMGSGPAQIDRLDRQRNVSIDVELGRRRATPSAWPNCSAALARRC